MQHLSDILENVPFFCLVGIKCVTELGRLQHRENCYLQDFIFQCWINGDPWGWVKENASVMSALQVCLSSKLSQLSAFETVSASG